MLQKSKLFLLTQPATSSSAILGNTNQVGYYRSRIMWFSRSGAVVVAKYTCRTWWWPRTNSQVITEHKLRPPCLQNLSRIMHAHVYVLCNSELVILCTFGIFCFELVFLSLNKHLMDWWCRPVLRLPGCGDKLSEKPPSRSRHPGAWGVRWWYSWTTCDPMLLLLH